MTASGRGLGLAIAQELAQEGVRVVLAARSAAKLHPRYKVLLSPRRGRRMRALHLMEPGPGGVDRIVQQAEDQLGPIDILVNNSGGPETASFSVTKRQ